MGWLIVSLAGEGGEEGVRRSVAHGVTVIRGIKVDKSGWLVGGCRSAGLGLRLFGDPGCALEFLGGRGFAGELAVLLHGLAGLGGGAGAARRGDLAVAPAAAFQGLGGFDGPARCVSEVGA